MLMMYETRMALSLIPEINGNILANIILNKRNPDSRNKVIKDK